MLESKPTDKLLFDVGNAHSLVFISSTNTAPPAVEKLFSVIEKSFSEKPNSFGLYSCFGRYDIVLDILSSTKVAMELVRECQRLIGPADISVVPCIDIKDESGFIEDFQNPLKCYCFLKWDSDQVVLRGLINRLNEKASGEAHLTLSILLGAYGFMVVARANKSSDLFHQLQLFKREGGSSLSVMSSIVAIKWAMRDQQEPTPIEAWVFVKTKQGELIDLSAARLRSMPRIVSSTSLIGYYDLMLAFKANSLSEVAQSMQYLRQSLWQRVSGLSVVLPYAANEHLDDTLSDVPGRLTYGRLQDMGISPKRRKGRSRL